MTPIQKTFSLIPELPTTALNGNPGATPTGPASRPPMTSKQAKKLYKAANKGPKMSKAEQRRHELMEQDRIRRELEKERNQARARTARDKKKEKKDLEKAKKKKKGLPLVEVHPSQDTLARFLRKKPALQSDITRSRNASPSVAGDDNSDVTLAAEADESRPFKRQRTEERPIEDSPNPPEVERQGISLQPESGGMGNLVAKEDNSKVSNSAGEHLHVQDDIRQPALNESFSADDGLFDDMDISLLELSTATIEVPTDEPQLPPCIDVLETNKRLSEREPEGTGRPVSKSEAEHKLIPRPKNVDTSRISLATTVTPPPKFDRTTGPEVVKSSTLQSHIHEEAGGKNDTSSDQLAHHNRSCSRPSLDSDTPETIPRTTDPLNNCKGPCILLPQDTKSCLSPQTSIFGGTVPLTKNHSMITNNENEAKKSAENAAETKRIPLEEIPVNMTKPSNNKTNAPELASKPAIPFHSGVNTPHSTSRKPIAPTFGPNSFRSPRTPNMGPPPMPPKFKSASRATTAGSEASPARFRPQQTPFIHNVKVTSNIVSGPRMESLPPSSTQMFLLNNLDNLFPSPSQEVKELYEGSGDKAHIAPARPDFYPPKRHMPPLQAGRFSSSRLPLDVKDKHTLALRASPRRPASLASAQKIAPATKTPTPLARPPGGDFVELSFPSTQDMFLSSQDLEEMEEKVSSVHGLGDSTSDSGSDSLSKPLPPRPSLGKGTPARLQKKHAPVPDVPTSKSKASKTDNAPSAAISVDGDEITSPRLASQKPIVIPENANRLSAYTQDLLTPRRLPARARGDLQREKSTETTSSMFTDEDIAELLASEDDLDQLEVQPAVEVLEPIQTRTPEPPGPSPKPFFTSSGNKEKMFLALERTKTAAWENELAQRKAQDNLQDVLRSAEERKNRELLEQMLEKEEKQDPSTAISARASPQPMKEANKKPQTSDVPKEREISGNHAPNQRRKNNSQGTQRRGNQQPQSSWEKMLKAIEEDEQKKAALAGQDEKARVSAPDASQESNYSDVAWDDLANI